ncbi:MAG: glycosyltransferase, partial [Muribaculaceae bacterium]|nr:glycosyltransferase [Muribaculaceae bacterium]
VFVVLLLKIIAMCSDNFSFWVTKSVYFYLSLASMVLGVQFFCTGLIGELITRNSAERNNYLISEEF